MGVVLQGEPSQVRQRLYGDRLKGVSEDFAVYDEYLLLLLLYRRKRSLASLHSNMQAISEQNR